VIFRTTDASKHCRITAGGSANDCLLPGTSNFAVEVPGTNGAESLPIEVQVDPSATVGGILFTEPQPWFRDLANWRDRMERLGLIKHFPIEAGAPSIVGDFDYSLPHLIGHQQ
jgi:hypothetical protein